MNHKYIQCILCRWYNVLVCGDRIRAILYTHSQMIGLSMSTVQMQVTSFLVGLKQILRMPSGSGSLAHTSIMTGPEVGVYTSKGWGDELFMSSWKAHQ